MRFALLLVVLAGCSAVEQSGMAVRAVDSQRAEIRGTINWGHPLSVVVSADTEQGWGIDLSACWSGAATGCTVDAGMRSVGITDRYTAARAAVGIVTNVRDCRRVVLGAAYESADVGDELRGFLEVGWLW